MASSWEASAFHPPKKRASYGITTLQGVHPSSRDTLNELEKWYSPRPFTAPNPGQQQQQHQQTQRVNHAGSKTSQSETRWASAAAFPLHRRDVIQGRNALVTRRLRDPHEASAEEALSRALTTFELVPTRSAVPSNSRERSGLLNQRNEPASRVAPIRPTPVTGSGLLPQTSSDQHITDQHSTRSSEPVDPRSQFAMRLKRLHTETLQARGHVKATLVVVQPEPDERVPLPDLRIQIARPTVRDATCADYPSDLASERRELERLLRSSALRSSSRGGQPTRSTPRSPKEGLPPQPAQVSHSGEAGGQGEGSDIEPESTLQNQNQMSLPPDSIVNVSDTLAKPSKGPRLDEYMRQRFDTTQFYGSDQQNLEHERVQSPLPSDRSLPPKEQSSSRPPLAVYGLTKERREAKSPWTFASHLLTLGGDNAWSQDRTTSSSNRQPVPADPDLTAPLDWAGDVVRIKLVSRAGGRQATQAAGLPAAQSSSWPPDVQETAEGASSQSSQLALEETEGVATSSELEPRFDEKEEQESDDSKTVNIKLFNTLTTSTPLKSIPEMLRVSAMRTQSSVITPVVRDDVASRTTSLSATSGTDRSVQELMQAHAQLMYASDELARVQQALGEAEAAAESRQKELEIAKQSINTWAEKANEATDRATHAMILAAEKETALTKEKEAHCGTQLLLEQARNEIAELRAEVAKLSREKSQMADDHQTATLATSTTMSSLRQDLNAALEREEALKHDLTAALKVVEDSQRRAEKLSSEIDVLRRKHSGLVWAQGEVSRLSRANAALEQEISRLKALQSSTSALGGHRRSIINTPENIIHEHGVPVEGVSRTPTATVNVAGIDSSASVAPATPRPGSSSSARSSRSSISSSGASPTAGAILDTMSNMIPTRDVGESPTSPGQLDHVNEPSQLSQEFELQQGQRQRSSQ